MNRRQSPSGGTALPAKAAAAEIDAILRDYLQPRRGARSARLNLSPLPALPSCMFCGHGLDREPGPTGSWLCPGCGTDLPDRRFVSYFDTSLWRSKKRCTPRSSAKTQDLAAERCECRPAGGTREELFFPSE